MNVLQAIDKLDELEEKISALKTAIYRLDHHEQNREKVILGEIKEEVVKERDHLRKRLEITQLTLVRGM